jgi:hypothetical protein
MTFVRCKFCFKIEDIEKLLIHNLVILYKEEENHFCYANGESWGILLKQEMCTCQKQDFVCPNLS